MGLRVIAGTLRRRQLRTLPGLATRPYTDRVRQMVFDRIGDTLIGARVADVFAGVGTMGIEALSRGAATCVFIEGNSAVHRVLRENVARLVSENKTVCWQTDVLRTSFRPQNAEGCLPYDLIFFDPPYAMAPGLVPGEPPGAAVDRIGRTGVTAAGDAVMYLRTPQKYELAEPAHWQIADRWEISSMIIWKLRRRIVEPASPTQVEVPILAEDQPGASSEL